MTKENIIYQQLNLFYQSHIQILGEKSTRLFIQEKLNGKLNEEIVATVDDEGSAFDFIPIIEGLGAAVSLISVIIEIVKLVKGDKPKEDKKDTPQIIILIKQQVKEKGLSEEITLPDDDTLKEMVAHIEKNS